ncbi:MAG: hypothetical protein CL433_11710 [Acidimicrobiaceae bacterium]|nr:hypothetical protein [Acidimicrobiaceae bacterium]HAB59093.1 hypothetical protein [Acidimicrobiaceae bacterium]
MTAMTERDRCERWFVRRGLPHLIDDYTATDDIFTRMAPFLAGVIFLEFFLAFGDRWTGWSQAVAFLGGIAALVGGVVLVNRIRGRRSFQLPDDIGLWELALYVLLPIVPTVIGSQGSAVENVVSVVAFNLVLLAFGYVVTSWALIPMMRWSFGQVRRQVTDVANLAMKSLPTLLIFSAFIFINAEMWQVANDFTLPLFGMVMLLLVGIGSIFIFVSVRRLTVDLARFSAWGDVRPRCANTPVEEIIPADDEPAPDTPPLVRRAEWNVNLLLFVAQGIQVLLVSLVITTFYVVFGLLTVREETLLQWTTVGELTYERDWAVDIAIFGTDLIFTRQLLLVALFIGMFSGLNFAVQVITDDTYREEFIADMTAEVRDALAVRAVYHRRLVATT